MGFEAELGDLLFEIVFAGAVPNNGAVEVDPLGFEQAASFNQITESLLLAQPADPEDQGRDVAIIASPLARVEKSEINPMVGQNNRRGTGGKVLKVFAVESGARQDELSSGNFPV